MTLIANPQVRNLTPALVEVAHKNLPNAAPPKILAEDEAVEIAFDGDDKATRTALAAEPLDIITSPDTDRKKQLLIADMESTIIEEECLDELADELNIRPQIADITARAMAGELEFEAALRARVDLLAGLPEAALDALYDRIHIMAGAAELIGTMRAHGAYCALVSGGFTFFTKRIAARLGFDTHYSNQLEIIDKTLSGQVGEPILGPQSKADILRALCEQLKISPAQTIAVGDGSNDIHMIREAGLGIAYRGKPVLAEAATANLRYGDLTALLYIQGYQKHEFAKADNGGG